MRRPRRRAGLLDLLILVAACAGAAAILRLYLALDSALAFDAADGSRQGAAWWLDPVTACRLVGLPLMPLSLGVLAMQLRRPGRRRLPLRPGFLACCPTPVIIATSLMVQGLALLVAGAPPDAADYLLNQVVEWWPFPIAASVSVLWAGALIAGRWRPEPTLPDRAGRVVGAAWVALFLAWTWLGGYTSLSTAHFFGSTRPAPAGPPAGPGVPPGSVDPSELPIPELPGEAPSPSAKVPATRP